MFAGVAALLLSVTFSRLAVAVQSPHPQAKKVSASCTVLLGVEVGTRKGARTISNSTVDKCCQSCFDTPACLGWTLDKTNLCILKDNLFGSTRKASIVASGRFPAGATRTILTRACQLDTQYPFCNSNLSTEARINDLMTRLTTGEKLAMMTARQSPEGGVPRLGVPEYNWGTNCIHGAQTRCGEKCPTSFPNPNAQGAAWNRTLWQAMAQVTALELRALWLADVGENKNDNLPHAGLNCWSPNINVLRDPRWGRALETPGEDPYLNGEYGTYHTQGLQQGPDKRFRLAIVVLKHFDAYSLEKGIGPYSRHNFNAVVDNKDLAETYWPAFKASVKKGKALGVMCSYNAVNGVPSCANKFFLSDVLRKRWGFQGHVTSDCDAIQDIYEQHHYLNSNGSQAVALAIAAGCDMDCNINKGHSSTGSPYTWYGEEAVKRGLLQEEVLDTGLRNLLRLRFQLGLFDPIADQPYWNYSVAETVATQAHTDLAKRATREGMVLLQNKNAVLPLRTGLSLAVLGPHAKAQQSLTGNYLGQLCPDAFGSHDCIQPVDKAIAQANAGGSVTTVQGCNISGTSKKWFAQALAAAKVADAVIMVMGIDTASIEKEGQDRPSLALPGVQAELVAQVRASNPTKPIVLVLINGGPVALDTVAGQVDGIIEAFYPGVYGSQVIAETIFGQNNPGGKLPYTVHFANYSALSNFTDMSMTNAPGRTYRYFTQPVQWPFGFGLSYTQFQLKLASPSSLTLSTTDLDMKHNVTVYLKNAGSRAGHEVVQAFFKPLKVMLPKPSALPLKQLFGFERVSLASRAVSAVSFGFSTRTFAVVDGGGDLLAAPGAYHLIFTNGHDQVLTLNLTIQGKTVLLEPFPTPTSQSND